MDTPGPWTVFLSKWRPVSENNTYRAYDVNKDQIAVVTGISNARLIAATPELLEALEKIGMTADQSGLDSQSTYDGVLEDIYEAAQEAIRKAKEK